MNNDMIELRKWLTTPCGPLYQIRLAAQAVQSDLVLDGVMRPELARDLFDIERGLRRRLKVAG